MPYDPSLRHRRSIRLPEYDYSSEGAYFLTLCTQNRECLFGEVVDGSMTLSPLGKIVAEEWVRSADIRDELTVDSFVVMPNHLHGIVQVVGPAIAVGAHGHAPLHDPLRRTPRSIGSFVARLKGAVTRRINTLRDTPGTPIWQRNYYEHIIRDEDDYHRIHAYIEDNPRSWAEDEYHPARES